MAESNSNDSRNLDALIAMLGGATPVPDKSPTTEPSSAPKPPP